MPRYAYHATSPDLVAAISRQGLVPQSQPLIHADEAREDPTPAIYFSVSPESASLWGTVLLRFPWPDLATPDWYSDTILLPSGEILETNWSTAIPIAPELLQIKTGQTWQPLGPRTTPHREIFT